MGCLGGQRWGWATHGRHWAPEITCRRRLNLGYNGAGGANWGGPRPTLASALSHRRGSLGHGSLGPTAEELGDGGRRWGGKVQGDRGFREAQAVPRLCGPGSWGATPGTLVIPACGQAQLSARGTAEGSLGSAHQKGGHLSCLTTELSTKAAPFTRVTKGFKMRGMVPHGFNYARARSAARPYRV